MMILKKKMTPDLSHELRTPLTAIHGALELLSTGAFGVLSQEGQRMVEIAANNADRLLNLIRVLEQEYASCDLISPADLARLHLERDLHYAIERQQLHLYYQPILTLNTQTLRGFEALIRWQHPSFGLISPDYFIPLAEENRSIIPVGFWVVQQACWQLANWQQSYPDLFSDLTVSINVSSKQLCDSGFSQQVIQILNQFSLSPDRLRLEVTESGIMENLDLAVLILQELRSLGIQIYIDDFGTGYSCLNRLHELPVDVIKLDRTFVNNMDSDSGEQMISMIIGLANSLGAQIIAEGIETEAQQTKLQRMGCNQGQGYLFAKPLPAEEVLAFVTRYSLAIVPKPQW